MKQVVDSKTIFKNKKVLLVGLGRLGGGLAMAKFFIAQGARLTITDTKTAEELKDSVKKLPPKGVNLVLGKHREQDFSDNEIIVCNQAVPIENPWIQKAFQAGKRVENNLSLFLEMLGNRPYLGITGTRGKTTTTEWLTHFINGSVTGGNVPGRDLLDIIFKKGKQFVLEIPSYQLEFMRKGLPAPRGAIITNLHIDHLNRHGTFKKYADTKARIFLNQTKDDFLVLNADDPNTKLFLVRKPRSAVFYTSLRALPKTKNGLFFVGEKIYFQKNGEKDLITAVAGMSEHEKRNLLAAMLGARLYGVSWKLIVSKIKTLPSVSLRQEVVLKQKGLMVINDSAATSPEATIAALEKFKSAKNLVLIAGGTDKQLEFNNLAKKIRRLVAEKNLYLLEGSATKKLVEELRRLRYFKKEPQIFENLKSIIQSIRSLSASHHPLVTILFSPGAASFEKFKNEFDRGKKFNELVRRYFKK